MKPSDIIISDPCPLTGTFVRTVREFAAAYIVVACRDNGDEWGEVLPTKIGEVIRDYRDEWTWIEASAIFGPPDIDGLIDQGDAEWVGDEGGRKRPVKLTEQGLEKLKKSRWYRKPKQETECPTIQA